MAFECYNCGGAHRKADCTVPCQQCNTKAKGGHVPNHTGRDCRKRYPSRGGGVEGGHRGGGGHGSGGGGGGSGGGDGEGDGHGRGRERGHDHTNPFIPPTDRSPAAQGGPGASVNPPYQGNKSTNQPHQVGRGTGGRDGSTSTQGRSDSHSQNRGRGNQGSRGQSRGGGRGGRGAFQGWSSNNSNNVQSVERHAIFDNTESMMHYPTLGDRPNLTPTGNSEPWSLPDELADCDARNLTIKEPSHPLRPSFFGGSSKASGKAKVDPNLQVLTNHFQYALTTQDMFEYRLTNMGTTDRRRIREIYQKAIESEPFLQSHQDKFVTNEFDMIVAWKDLHQYITSTRVRGDGVNDGTWDLSITIGKSTVSLQFELIRKLDTSTIQQYSLGDPSAEKETFESVSRCLNLVMSKTFDKVQLYRHSANKFYVKKARESLSFPQPDKTKSADHSTSLEIVRGYYYTVKPGMGNIILNFNLATSAFLRPIRVSNFLADKRTFPGCQEQILKNMQVYLITDRVQSDGGSRGNLNSEKYRIKKVHRVDSKTIGELMFNKRKKGDDGKFMKNADGTPVKESTESSVLEYLQTTFATTFDPSLKPIDCGNGKDPVWYAQEQLVIVPWQILRQPVPKDLTGSMVNQAAKDPDQGRALIEKEGLAALGIMAQSSTSTQLVAIGGRDDVPVKMSGVMLQVRCQRLDFPQPRYKQPPQPRHQGLHVPHAPAKLEDYEDSNSKKGSRWKMPYNSVFFAPKPKPLRYRVLRPSKKTAESENIDPSKWDDSVEEKDFAAFKVTVATYLDEFKQQLTKCGLDRNQIFPDAIEHELPDLRESTLQSAVRDAKSANMDLVILILRGHDVPAYAAFKRLADRTFGMHTVCMLHGRLKDLTKQSEEYITNIMMKVNLKMGGTSHSVGNVFNTLKQGDIMVLGADVVHPGPGAYSGCPSIAAIVGSVDYHVGRCLGSMRLQKTVKRDENGRLVPITDREIIQEVKVMVTERLEAWIKLSGTRKLPQSIVYYRDGTSGTQYNAVKTFELTAIREAYQELAQSRKEQPNVNLTAVVVTKRHHTRFFPTSAAPKKTKDFNKPVNPAHFPDRDQYGNWNTKPGTCVDELVTSPYYQDFFLQSHSGIKGTAKPTHYFVLEDGIPNLTLAGLRDLTHGICYSYARATVGVSYASPTYYADHLCERGRLYVSKFFTKSDPTLDSDLEDEKKTQTRAKKSQRDIDFATNETMSKEEKEKMAKNKKLQEILDRKEIGLLLKEVVYQKVHDEFYAFRHTGWMNPWNKELSETMFWM